MKFRYLRNLSSSDLREGIAPWEFAGRDRVPEECLGDKKARDKWINDPQTDYHVYSGFEGVNPDRRLRAGNGNEDDANPPALQWFAAVDCDVPMTVEEAHKWVGLMDQVKPMWFEETLSGNGRFLFMFEEPVKHPSRKFARYFQEHLYRMLPLALLPGIDKGALSSIERYFTNGGRWTKVSDCLIPASVVRGFTLKLAESFNWRQKEFGKAVSLEKVRDELARKFPRFSEWPGDFALESQGPTFWVEGSESPKSAIVKETGMYTFSGHASKAFYGWAELVGKEFVEVADAATFGDAVKDIFYDGKTFFYKDARGKWRGDNKDNLRLILGVGRNLTARAAKGEKSELDRALHFILEQQQVDGAASCAFYPKGLFQYHSKTILNTHDRDVMAPAEEPAEWGPAGKFPHISALLGGFFLPVEAPVKQLDYFLARWRRAYQSCLVRQPLPGQGIILAGATGLGKTAIGRGLVGKSMGGFAEPGAYLTGATTFNSELFDYGVWCLDDQTNLSSETVHRLYSEGLKRGVANTDHSVNEKFRKATSVPWSGLIFVTCNDDPESLRGIPNTDISNREKFLIFRVNPDSPYQFAELYEQVAIFDRELPHFLRWLLDWTPPDYVTKGAPSRFGIHPYCEPSLLRAANQSSGSNAFGELLQAHLRDYFIHQSPGAAFWEGTATDLRVAMSVNPAYSELLRPYRPEQFGRMVAQLSIRSMFKMEAIDTDEGRIWRIHRDPRLSPKKSAPVTQTANSQFSKT